MLFRARKDLVATSALVLTLTLFFIAGCVPLVQDGYYGRVVYVYDGDTVKLANGEKVRYIGVDTPEMNYKNPPAEYFAEEAKRFNERLVNGKRVRLEFDTERRDKYNRLLAYVYIDNISVSAKLIEEGYARVFIIPPNIRYADDFLKLQQKAREEERGLWSE
ncbi:MAG: thermonuclease family protein [Candidatus Omnitrophica bacterium]|nr:thermonuclease family protein [Candidatus Omnitrophota bacterium]